MGKAKSAIVLSLISIVIAVLLVVCFVSFPCGDVYYFNSILALTETDATLGGELVGDTAYVGGGYSVVYYPEGVISQKEYEETCMGKTGDELEEYTEKYERKGAIYLEKDVVLKNGTSEVQEEFITQFENSVSLLRTRFEDLHCEGVEVSVRDGYTIRVLMPAMNKDTAAAFQYLSYTGEFTMAFGSDEASATTFLPAQKGTKHTADYYIEGAYAEQNANQNYVVIEFTEEGQEAVKKATADGTGSIFFKVGEEIALTLSVSEQIDQDALYISSSAYTAEGAAIIASLIDSAVAGGTADDMTLNLGEISYLKASYGENALNLIYIALGVSMVAMFVFFVIRYRALAFVQLYTFLIYTIAMLLCVWSIGTLYLSLGTMIAYALGAILLCISNAVSFDAAKKEFNNGRTMSYSVKTGYKKSLWKVLDLHIVLAIISVMTFAISLTGINAFALTLTLGVVFSAISTLFINRFIWHVMMRFSKNQAKFCNFKRELEVEDDD